MKGILSAGWWVVGAWVLAAGLGLAPGAAAQVTIPAATIDIEDAVPDTHGLLPLNNWSPLFRIGMKWSNEEEAAPRNLVRLSFIVTTDGEDDRPYDRVVPVRQADLYEFALIREGGDPEEDYGTLDDKDQVIYVWDPTGYPIGQVDSSYSPMTYTMDFSGLTRGTGTWANPEYPVPNSSKGMSYFVAVRTSVRWVSGQTLDCEVLEFIMADLSGGVPFNPGPPPTPIDSYSPNMWEGDTLETGAYSSSFAVYDVTGSTSPNYDVDYANAWSWPHKYYTPTSEYLRPRWDRSLTAYDLVEGEWMEMRRLFSVETWTAVIGLNMHGTDASVREVGPRLSTLGAVGLPPGSPPNPFVGVSVDNLGGAYPLEVNVVMTDMGADPFGPPGNGGINPSEGLDRMSYAEMGAPDLAFGSDRAFNGLWFWHDTNNNFVFDRPTPVANGVSLSDRPALPHGIFYDDGQNPAPLLPSLVGPAPNLEWEWVPFPPVQGGWDPALRRDPWWRITLGLENYEIDGGGRLEPTPDDASGGPLPPTAFYCDYFVCIRPDSGYTDSSLLPGDGTGITLGADMRVLLEPRDQTGNPFAGGILISTQIPTELRDLWHVHPGWNPTGWTEPWWPQRTQNMNNTKAVRCGYEVHDMVLTYESNSNWKTWTYIDYSSSAFLSPLIGVPTGGWLSIFDDWMDPWGALASQFVDFYSVDVVEWVVIIPGVDDSENGGMQQPYESAPFFSWFDVPPNGPRSYWFPNPPAQPERPAYWTWPYGQYGTGAQLPPYQYPRERDWPDANVRARMLKQHADADSRPVGMLSINVCGANDPITNQHNALYLEQITVALWGPDLDRDGKSDFTPDDLKPLDPKGTSASSGVALFVDTGSGTLTDVIGGDRPLELNGLAWRQFPEYIDLDGDKQADDLNGDGVLNDLDKAWVLRLRPKEAWRVPVEDDWIPAFGGGGGTTATTLNSGASTTAASSQPTAKATIRSARADAGDASGPKRRLVGVENNEPMTVVRSAQGDSTIGPVLEVASSAQDVPAVRTVPHSSKVVHSIDLKDGPIEDTVGGLGVRIPGDPDGAGNSGDDLHIVIRTSDTVGRFEKFKAVIPAWLPERAAHDRVAGIQFSPQFVPSLTGYEKHHPEELAVQSFFEHELLEVNVPVKTLDLTGTNQILPSTGAPLAVVGLDISTNRGVKGTLASGSTGTGGQRTFTVGGANWTPGAFVGQWLVDSNYESYQITANTADQLTLLSGAPRSGAWWIAKDPTFLEQVIVEFYDASGGEDFNILEDLLPLQLDQRASGVALYRDNDFHSGNRNGTFDPDIDIPLKLDYPPYLIGQQGEPTMQVMFVFSSPGTDNVPLQGYPSGLANQPRRRQVVPDTWGASPSHPDYGTDFFVVLRAAGKIAEEADFYAAIVSWGPNTPTEPDPDTFPPPPLAQVGEFDIFSEFPWGYRAVGFITIFKDITLYDRLDNSGFNWVRSACNNNIRTNLITIKPPAVQPDDVVITSVSHEVLPRVIPPQGVPFVIRGTGFGTAPRADLNGTLLLIQSAGNTLIQATIPGGTTLSEPVVLTVTNTQNGRSGIWTQISLTDELWTDAPTITRVSPSSGTSNDFPVTIFGTRFDQPVVLFEQTSMPIVEWSPTRIVVAFPSGGLPKTGPLDVTVRNADTGLFATLADGFRYTNYPAGGIIPIRPCFIATAAYGSPFEAHLTVFRDFRDGVLLKSAAGAALVDLYYHVSPAVAEQVAARPWVATLVRLVLTPLAWLLEWPALGVVLLACASGIAGRKLRQQTSR